MKLPPPRIDIRGLQAVKVGVRRFTLDDPYYLILAMRWPTFLAAVLAIFFATNLTFATLYWLVPGSVANARPGVFADAFFFSVETLATVGYGVMTPASIYAHSVVTAEIFVGMFLTALLTGAFFARFARPQPKLVFSRPAVIAPYEDGMALMVRVASRRLQGISEASARISYLSHVHHGATRFRRFTELPLVRSNIPVLSLSWTLIHPITETSPLFGLTAADLATEGPTLMVSISGFDEAISSVINDRKGYRPEDIQYGRAFENILRDLPGGFVEVDITRIHEVAPADCGEDQASAISDS